jgi:hypothetical protein
MNLLCPVCGKLFYGIDIGKPCPHVKEKPDGTYEFIPPQVNPFSESK